MVLNRVFSVGSAALVLAGALALNTLVPFSTHLSEFSVQAQTTPATTTGSTLVGPNEANVDPAIADKVAGIPMVVIIKATEGSSNWQAEIQKYGAATPLVIRVADIDVATVNSINWTQKGNELAGTLVATGKQTSIVVFGNELNNLDREWHSRSAPTDASQVTDAEVIAAASAYGGAYVRFKSGMGSVGRVAPAPPDMSNPIYPWEKWVQPIEPLFKTASARVLNAYEVGGTVNEKISYFEGKYGPVDFLTEVGIDPATTDLSAHLTYLNGYTGGPNGNIPAATLVPNHCQPGGWKNGGSVDDWLFYIKGQIFDRAGNLIDPSTCDANTVQVPAGKPVFLYPDPNMDITGFTNELDMYLANSQAYCAPPQVFWPNRPVTNETIVLQDGRVIDANNYPSVDITEDVSITSLSFPLFRSDLGGISVESDLSRVKAGETLSDAIRRNSRVDSAPQFYLSSPQTQCTSAARYVQHVKDLCEQDGFDVSNPANPELAKCGANLSVKMLDGEYRRITDLLAAEYLPNESVCENYTLEDVSNSTPRAVAVQGISPYTPKVYKMGFYVQHTFLTGSQNTDLWHSSLRNASQIVAWFTGQEVSFGSVVEPQERVDVVPVWYHAGLTSSEFDQNQVRPYSIDLREYSTDGTIQAKNFDPTARTEVKQAVQQSGAKIDPKTSPVAEPLVNAQNYAGPLWRTYSFVLPQHVQENIAVRKLQLVYQNYYLLQFMRANLGHNRLLQKQEIVNGIGTDIITKLRFEKEKFWANEQFTLPFECSLGGGAVTDLARQTCTQFRDIAYDPQVGYDGLPMTQTYEEIGAAFPVPVLPAQKDQLDLLKKSLVARINAGVQVTRAYTPEPAQDELVGPLSIREIGAACQVDQANIRRGIEETATDITSNALQPLQAADDEPTDPPRNPITNLSNAITAWIFAGPSPAGDQYLTNRVTSAYLILPDDAMGIETLQSYVSPLFLSPEMYQSIMSGENPVYPFKEVWDELMKGADFSNEAQMKLSAFLRTDGPTRSVSGEDDGFVKANLKIYRPICQTDAAGAELCGCGELIQTNPPVWMTLTEYNNQQAPSTANSCIGYEEIERRTVGVQGNQPEKTPSMGVSVPGNTFAMGEFLRRLAFTPLHQQKNSVYTGLENFYKGLGNADGSGPTKPNLNGLSEYFRTLITGLPTVQSTSTGDRCEVVYVSKDEGASMIQPVQTLLSYKDFARYMANEGLGSGKSTLFDTCGSGTGSCVDFIANTLLTSPVCDGSKYINPVIAFGIAWNETRGLQEGVDWPFGCSVTAFTKYNAGAQFEGLACTVTSARQNTVLNPLITAKYGRGLTAAGAQNVVNQCVDIAGGGVRDDAVLKDNTPEDGFACSIVDLQFSCTNGLSDAEALESYLSEGRGYPQPMDRYYDFSTIAERQIGKSLPDDPKVRQAISDIRLYYQSLKSRTLSSNCGKKYDWSFSY